MIDRIPPRWRFVVAFAAVYLIWGSTYLAIRFAIETLPPFLMAGVRFLIAGSVLYVWQRARGAPRPQWEHWRSALIIGGLLMLGGNGMVSWAEEIVPSGLAALLIATEPLWIVILAWSLGTYRPSALVIVGLLMGFAGVLFLVGPENIAGGQRVHPVGAAILVFAALSWATGSLYSREALQSPSQWLATALVMLAGGVLLMVTAVFTGDFARLDLGAISLKSSIALAYLVVFGSIIALRAYLWLMQATSPARASTYAYVNPIVALLLGWLVASEPLSPRSVVAAVVIIGAVALMVSTQERVELGPPDATTIGGRSVVPERGRAPRRSRPVPTVRPSS